MSHVIIHESGRKTIVDGNIGSVSIEVRESNGQLDRVEKVMGISEIPKDNLRELMRDPQNFDVSRYSTGEIKDHEY